MPPRRSNRKPLQIDEEVDNNLSDGEDLQQAHQDLKRRNSRLSKSKKRIIQSQDDDDNDNDCEDYNDSQKGMKFSSQLPESTQDIMDVKAFEKANLMKLSEMQRDKALTDLTRLVLFKALAGEVIDRTKCIKEAGINDARIASAAFEEVNVRLQDSFHFELKRQPLWMNQMKNLNSVKYTKDRYYLINTLKDWDDSMHTKAIHSVHQVTSIEKGFLMVVLAFTYCKGEPRNDGSRWILDKNLYLLLNQIDENIPAEPPVAGATKKNRTGGSSSSHGGRRESGSGGVACTPDVDYVLDKLYKRDYLLKEKADDEQMASNNDVDENSYFYSMGPRAALEIGRKQVIYFCSELLEEDPDPSMLAELEEEEMEEENENEGSEER